MKRLAALALFAGCHAQCSRPHDDPLEPNNDPRHATRLERGTPVQARSVEGDVDDWAFDARAGEHLALTVKPLVMFGEITLTGPSGEVITSARGNTSTPEGWRYQLDADTDGTYVLSILQGSAADNQFWFQWDYTVELSP